MYYVDGLHAKIVVSDRFASVGSQNLTKGGTRNKEASIVTTDPHIVAAIRQCVEHWRTMAQPIDLEMIDLMEQLVKPLRRRMTKVTKDLVAADLQISREIRQREQARVEAEQRKQEAEALSKQREQEELLNALFVSSSKLRSVIATTRPSESMNITVKDVHWEDPYGWNSGTYNTMQLSNPRGNDMCRWFVDGDEIYLQKRDPYLIILHEIGRLAFVLVKKVQTKDFGTTGQFSKPLSAIGNQWYVRIEFAHDLEDLKTWNVKFVLAASKNALNCSPGDMYVEAHCYFTMIGLSVVRVSRSGDDPYFYEMEKGLQDGDPQILDGLRRYLLDARRFGWQVWIQKPEKFFRGFGYRFNLHLHRMEGSLFLTAQQIL